MKIDVEGAELDVLRGAEATIHDHRPTMLVEVHWLGEAFLRYLSDVILPLGYSAKTIDGQPVPDIPVRCHVSLRAGTHASTGYRRSSRPWARR
jgi:hypothetical protein